MVKVVEEYNDVVLVELNSLLLLMVENLMNNQDLIVHQNHLLLNLMVVVVVQWKEVLLLILMMEMEEYHDDDRIIYTHQEYIHGMDLIQRQDDHRNRTIFLLLDFYNKLNIEKQNRLFR